MVTKRWDPFGGMISLRDAMDRLLEQSLIRTDRSLSSDMVGSRALPMDVYERDGDYVIKAYVPGVSIDHIEISIDRGSLLTIKAHVGTDIEKEEAKKYNWLINELMPGDVSRTLTMPTMVEVGKIEANVDNGVLTLVLPKAEEAKPRQIKITSSKKELG